MNRGSSNSIPGIFVTVCLLLVSAALPAASAHAQQHLVTAIQDVAKKAIPSVVHVEVTEKQSVKNPLLPFQNDPFFQYFFGNPKMPKKFEREVVGLGSGILLDEKGHILTNSHVVNGATKTIVMLSDGRRYTGDAVKVVGVDPKTDLAVIQVIDSKGAFPFARFGDSDKVDVGQWVVAIGHPQGLDQTVTQGIISAKHRHGIADPTSYQDFLQTDAAINPGNSGGPLLNLDAEVIGVNAAIVSGSGGFEGIGFAIPSNLALHVAQQLIPSGKVERGWIGITIQNLTPELAQSFGLSDTKGALVANVLRDSPGAAAGLKQGDVIVEFQGKKVEDPDELRNRVASAPVGRPVTLTVRREGRTQEISVKPVSDQEHSKTLLLTVRERYGIEVRPVTKKEAAHYELNDGKGVMVSHVQPRGAFAKVGMEVGDIILEVDRHDVDTVEDFATYLSMAPAKKKIVLTVFDHRTRRTGLLQMNAP